MTGAKEALRQYEDWRYCNKGAWDWRAQRKRGVFYAVYQCGSTRFEGAYWHSIKAAEDEARYFLSHNKGWNLVRIMFGILRWRDVE